MHSINGYTTYTKPVGFADKLIHLLYDENLQRPDEKVLPVPNIIPIDEVFCKLDNSSPIGFDDQPHIYEHRRWLMLNDDCRMCRSMGYRQRPSHPVMQTGVMSPFHTDTSNNNVDNPSNRNLPTHHHVKTPPAHSIPPAALESAGHHHQCL